MAKVKLSTKTLRKAQKLGFDAAKMVVIANSDRPRKQFRKALKAAGVPKRWRKAIFAASGFAW